MNWTKKLLMIAVLIAAGYAGYLRNDAPTPTINAASQGDEVLAAAYEDQASNLQVQGHGTVIKTLSDDRQGNRHQRFLLRLDSGQTILIAHNIDLAPRIADLEPGDNVAFNGEYEWNAKGGVIHWTHDDPDGSHPGGWLKHENKTYH